MENLTVIFTPGENNFTDETTDGFCKDNSSFVIIALCINFIAISMSVFHIAMLATAPQLKANHYNYFCILIQITAASMANNMIYSAVVFSCSIKRSLLNIESLSLQIALDTIFAMLRDGILISRFWIMTLAVYDKYLGICKPFQYSDNRFVNNINKCSFSIWGCMILLMAVQHSVSTSLFPEKASTFSTMIISLLVLAATIGTLVLAVKLAMELRAMSKRAGPGNAGADEVENAAKYMLFTAVLYYCTFLPMLALTIGYFATTDHSGGPINFELFREICLLPQLLFGVLNVLLFAHMNCSYSSRVKQMFCKVNPGRVNPLEG